MVMCFSYLRRLLNHPLTIEQPLAQPKCFTWSNVIASAHIGAGTFLSLATLPSLSNAFGSSEQRHLQAVLLQHQKRVEQGVLAIVSDGYEILPARTILVLF